MRVLRYFPLSALAALFALPVLFALSAAPIRADTDAALADANAAPAGADAAPAGANAAPADADAAPADTNTAPAAADTAPADTDRQAVIDNLTKSLKKSVPDIGDIIISETPLPGIYQMVSDGKVAYVSEDGKYLIQGRLLDLVNWKDLTAEALNGARKAMLAPLANNRLIPFAAPAARHEVTVFTDVTCSYCRRFHRNMRAMNDLGISVNYLLTPVLSERARVEAVSVWCARDRAAALTAAKLGQLVPEKQCENPIESNLRLAKSLQVSGTPAIFLADGTLLPGFVEPARLLEMIEKAAAPH